VRVIGPRVLELADRDASAFRDRRVFPVEPQAVTAIAWRSVGGTGELRATEGRWQNGRGEWVASERVAEALRRLLALRADAFATGRTAAGPQGGSRGLAVTAGAARVAVDVGADGEIARGEERLRVAADVIDEAFRSVVAAGVRDDRLVTQLPDTITDITLADDRARVVLQRLHGAWTFLSPKVAYAADTRVVDDWLARLGAVRTATRSGGPHARRLTVTGRYPESVEVSAPADVYALLAPEPLRFRERGVLSFARFDVRGLARTADNGIEKVAIDAAGAWHAPVGKTVDAAAVARVIGALSDLHAQDFVAAPPPGAPAVNVQIAVQPPGEARPANHTVQVWTRASDCVARLDRDTTFTLERAACDALRLDLFAKAD
jgi:hypothetical protein